MLGFFIDDGATLQFLTETTLTKASGKYGQKLHDRRAGARPARGHDVQRPRLAADDAEQEGRQELLGPTTGCKAHKHPYKADLTFIDNQVTTAGRISKSSTASCTK